MATGPVNELMEFAQALPSDCRRSASSPPPATTPRRHRSPSLSVERDLFRDDTLSFEDPERTPTADPKKRKKSPFVFNRVDRSKPVGNIFGLCTTVRKCDFLIVMITQFGYFLYFIGKNYLLWNSVETHGILWFLYYYLKTFYWTYLMEVL
jgi:hypothetical protein